MSEEQRRLLEKQLWAVANILRGKMNADEYRNYILGFIFYKYLSEKLEKFINEKLLVREDFVFSEIDEDSKKGKTILEEIKKASVSHLGFFLKPTDLFGYLVKKGNGEIKGENTFILENLKNVLNTIEQTSMGTASEDDFKGLFDDVVLTSPKLGKSEQKKNEVIVEVLTKLSEIDFKLEDSKSDLLGDAYEYLIGEFAAGAGKKGGEFYTPAQVSRLLAQIVTEGKKRLKSVYDPTCGSGSLLLRIGDYANVSMYYGQELNPTTYNLARMNMILHGVPFDNFSVRQGDTLVDDMHLDLQAEAVVANPPFSAEWKSDGDPLLVQDERFSQYGRLAPKNRADYAFVAHMLHHLAENGTMAVILPHGVLFAGGANKVIRKYIIENQNYLDAIIGLPANLFYGTGIPAVVMVFKKCRKVDDDILFIDASSEFENSKNQNRLSDKNIQKIFETYSQRKEVEKYSHRASLDEIRENEHNLNLPRYVDILKNEEPITLTEVTGELALLEKEEKDIKLEFAEYLEDLSVNDISNLHYSILLEKIFSGKVRFTGKQGNDFPDWKIIRIGDIVSEYNEKSEKINQYPMLTSSREGLMLQSEYYGRNNRITDRDNTGFNILPEGFITYRSRSDDGVFHFNINELGFNGLISTYYPVFTSKNGNNYFLMLLLNRNWRTLYKYSVGTSQKVLSFTELKKIKFAIPCNEEQEKIALFVKTIDKLISNQKKQISLLNKWKSGLVQQMFV